MEWAGHVTCMGRRRNADDICRKTWREERSEDLGIGRMIILEWILEKGWEGVDWLHLNKDRDQWGNLWTW